MEKTQSKKKKRRNKGKARTPTANVQSAAEERQRAMAAAEAALLGALSEEQRKTVTELRGKVKEELTDTGKLGNEADYLTAWIGAPPALDREHSTSYSRYVIEIIY